MALSQNTWPCHCKALMCSLVWAQLQLQIQLLLSSALNLQWVWFSGPSGFTSTHRCTQRLQSWHESVLLGFMLTP